MEEAGDPCPYRRVWWAPPGSRWWKSWCRGGCRAPWWCWSWSEPPHGPGLGARTAAPGSSRTYRPVLWHWPLTPGSYTAATSPLQKMHQHLLEREEKNWEMRRSLMLLAPTDSMWQGVNSAVASKAVHGRQALAPEGHRLGTFLHSWILLYHHNQSEKKKRKRRKSMWQSKEICKLKKNSKT